LEAPKVEDGLTENLKKLPEIKVIFEPVEGRKVPATKPLVRLEVPIATEELVRSCFPKLNSMIETDVSEKIGILHNMWDSEIQKEDDELVFPSRIRLQLSDDPNEFPRMCKLVAPDVGESDETAAILGLKYEKEMSVIK
jgi:hypothetical protein